jgi:hypothetical protein
VSTFLQEFSPASRAGLVQAFDEKSMNFESVHTLLDFKFLGGLEIARLQVTCGAIPQSRGIYLIARKGGKPVRFL